jgi:predicted NBD/HSP70 family sugar kinase
VRQRNLAAVLHLVHRSRGLTRADLTRMTGLNRSTIGDLVAALAEANWVSEIDNAPREGVGRPSPRVLPRPDRLVAAINPELDAIDVALVALGGHVVARKRVTIDAPTVEQAVSIAARAVRELAAEHPSSHVVAAGAAVPGLVRRADGLVRLAPHLGWHDEPFAEPLGDALGVPAFAANDAQLGCRAELAFGAGLGARNLVYLNGGPSGIGGGIVIEGRLVEGRDGHAGEFGHVAVDPLGPECACGARGCLEAVVRREHLESALALRGVDDTELRKTLLASADAGVAALVARQWQWVRLALRGVVNVLNPDRVILGGHLAVLWEALDVLDRQRAAAEALDASGNGLAIVQAALGADRLVTGAAELAWETLLADPLAQKPSSGSGLNQKEDSA